MPSTDSQSQSSLKSSAPEIRVDVQQVLSFFDEKPPCSRGHATAIVSVLGEDLAAASFRHCLLANGATEVNIRCDTVGTGKQRGPRLDRWIEADLEGGRRVLFQAEIKSWSAHAIGGRPLAIDADRQEITDYKDWYWKQHWHSRRRTLNHPNVAKVLVRMKPPFDCDNRERLPLIMFWAPVGPRRSQYKQNQSAGGHLFSISKPTCNFPFDPPASWPEKRGFDELWVFSVSSYLRSLRTATVSLPMPDAAARLGLLDRMTELE